MTKLTPEGCRAARAILGWSISKLLEEAKAADAGMSATTIAKIEAGGSVRQATADKLIALFAAHEVEVLNGDAPGARRRRVK